MPLRDHFRAPLDDMRHWESMHGMWPAMILAGLQGKLPRGFFAELKVLPAQDVYEIQVYDRRRRARLVAAVELVAPSNKDRPESRRAFVAKCANLLRERVAVVIVDIVTTRTSNLYGELLEMLGRSDPNLAAGPLYSAGCPLYEARHGLAIGSLDTDAVDRTAPADHAPLAGRRSRRTVGTGKELRGELPKPGHRVIRNLTANDASP